MSERGRFGSRLVRRLSWEGAAARFGQMKERQTSGALSYAECGAQTHPGSNICALTVRADRVLSGARAAGNEAMIWNWAGGRVFRKDIACLGVWKQVRIRCRPARF